MEDENADKQSIESIEIGAEKSRTDLENKKLDDHFFDTLGTVNQDFKAAYQMARTTQSTRVIFYNFATGPFAANDARIKQNYLMGGSPL